MAARRLAITHHGRQVAFSVLAEALPGFQQMLGIQPGFYALGQFGFTGGVEQRRLADAVQIDAHEVRRGALSIRSLSTRLVVALVGASAIATSRSACTVMGFNDKAGL